MSAPARTEPGTSVARQAERTQQLDPARQRHLEEIRAQNALVMTINSESWGAKLSRDQQRAFAEYMRRFRLDISEIDNLGGKPYKNGRYYERKIAEMRTKGLVEWSDGQHIGPNAELATLAASGDEWAVAENIRRMRERIRWDIPADATHAYVTRVKLKGDKNPLEGCDFITPTRLNSYGKVADPIGAAEPEKTVITRAWRRVGLIAASEIPELKAEEDAMDVAAIEVAEEVEHFQEIEDERESRARALPPGRSGMPASQAPLVDASNPYSDIDESKLRVGDAREVRENVPSRDAQPRTAGQRATAQHVAETTTDPYADAPKGEPAENVTPETPVARRRYAIEEVRCPMGARVGYPLWMIASKDLHEAYEFSRTTTRYKEFTDAAESVLEMRAQGDIPEPTDAELALPKPPIASASEAK